MVRDRRVIEIRVLTAIAGVLLLAGAMVGCGGGGEENADGRGGERGSAPATDESTTVPEEGRPASGAARGGAGLDVEVVSPGGAYQPVGFGEGSLWATEPFTCNDTMSASGSASASSSGGASFPSTMIMESSAQAMCAPSDKMLLEQLDPQTGEEVATITLEGFFAETLDVAVGAGSVWATAQVSVGTRLYRIDPRATRVVASEHGPDPSEGGYGGLVAGGGYVWFESGDGLARVAP